MTENREPATGRTLTEHEQVIADQDALIDTLRADLDRAMAEDERAKLALKLVDGIPTEDGESYIEGFGDVQISLRAMAKQGPILKLGGLMGMSYMLMQIAKVVGYEGDDDKQLLAEVEALRAYKALADELAAEWRPIQYIDTDSKLGIDWLARYDALTETQKETRG